MKSISVGEQAAQGWGHELRLDARFMPLVERLEGLARNNPTSYRRRVIAAGLVGYSVIIGMLTLFVGLTLAMIALMITTGTGLAAEAKLALLFGLLAFSLIRALWVSPIPPDGVPLQADEAPRLFDMIERIRADTDGPAIHAVHVTDQMNAAITQESRLLFLGGRNILFLGLPLLQALTQPEIEAVIAHEFGHFTGRHGHTAAFAYRVRLRWAQLAERLPHGIVSGLLRRFFNWYGPWFAAYSFVMARQQEYEADRLAASVTGADVMANALIRITAQSDRFNAAWAVIWRQAPLRDDPPASPCRTIASALAGEDADDRAAIARALDRVADMQDTHPTLAQRLDALNRPATMPAPPERPAAPDLLAARFEALTDHFDAQWHEWADANWAEERRQRQTDEAEKAELAAGIATGNLERESLYRHAWLTEVTETPERAAEAYALVLRHYPDATDARFRRGDMLLDMKNDSGIDLLLGAAQAQEALRIHAYRHIVDYLYGSDRAEEATLYHERLQEAERQQELAQAEASHIDENVILRPLTPELQARLAQLSSAVPGLASLHAAMRDMRHAAEPQIIFLFTAAKGYAATELLDQLIDAMLPAGDLIGLENSRKRRWLFRRIACLPNSCIAAVH